MEPKVDWEEVFKEVVERNPSVPLHRALHDLIKRDDLWSDDMTSEDAEGPWSEEWDWHNLDPADRREIKEEWHQEQLAFDELEKTRVGRQILKMFEDDRIGRRELETLIDAIKMDVAVVQGQLKDLLELKSLREFLKEERIRFEQKQAEHAAQMELLMRQVEDMRLQILGMQPSFGAF